MRTEIERLVIWVFADIENDLFSKVYSVGECRLGSDRRERLPLNLSDKKDREDAK